MPALASCVEVVGQKPSETSSGMTHLPTIQRSLHITKMLSISAKAKWFVYIGLKHLKQLQENSTPIQTLIIKEHYNFFQL